MQYVQHFKLSTSLVCPILKSITVDVRNVRSPFIIICTIILHKVDHASWSSSFNPKLVQSQIDYLKEQIKAESYSSNAPMWQSRSKCSFETSGQCSFSSLVSISIILSLKKHSIIFVPLKNTNHFNWEHFGSSNVL